jgi:hypothetical protein
MRPLVKQHPGQSVQTLKTGAVRVNGKIYFLNCNCISAKLQTISRLFSLVSMIPADGYFKPELSLAIDRVLVEVGI